MRDITGIIIHCSATRPEWMEGQTTLAKVNRIREWHRARGWSDIGYHYIIDRNGAVAKGRPVSKVGAHVKGHNTGTIGVCLIGGHAGSAHDTFGEHFTPDQADSLRRLLQQLAGQFGPVSITGHNQYSAKGCPSFYVPRWLEVSPVTQPAKQPAKRSIWAVILDLLSNLLGRRK